MDILKQFNDLIAPKKQQAARVIAQKGADAFVAETPAGLIVVITGTTQVGQHVYYDDYTKRIIGQAPAVAWTGIPV